MKAPSTPREIALPADALRQLREALRDETDPLTAIHVLHSAGYASAESFWAVLSRSADPAATDDAAFWSRLSDLFARRGWGRLAHERPHPGVGVLTSADWAEADDAEATQPSCGFSAGLISGVLTRAAGGGVAVLETSCRARGDDVCRFCFGSEETIHELYDLLLRNHGLDDALARL